MIKRANLFLYLGILLGLLGDKDDMEKMAKLTGIDSGKLYHLREILLEIYRQTRV